VNDQNNFIVLDRGFKDGIKRHMSVVCPMGIVGVVVESAEHYSLVMSVLNSKFEIIEENACFRSIEELIKSLTQY
jgi:rod shape-determining protein MreC